MYQKNFKFGFVGLGIKQTAIMINSLKSGKKLKKMKCFQQFKLDFKPVEWGQRFDNVRAKYC